MAVFLEQMTVMELIFRTMFRTIYYRARNISQTICNHLQ